MPRTPSPISRTQHLFKGDSHRDFEKLVARNSSSNKRKRKKKIAFGWYGGKFSHLDWLLPLLPQTHQYCEPFAGSAAVLLNRPPSAVETYNDLDGEVVNFFRTLRDERELLIEAIGLTPFSREEFAIACEPVIKDISSVERARRFYIKARQVRTGLAQTASLGRWANCKKTSRAGMSGVVSRWLGGIEQLDDIAQRLMRVQIENRPAIEVITLYDDNDTLFYCDPPYVHGSRGDNKAYGYEMSDEDHQMLAKCLAKVSGKVAISGYDSTLYHELFDGWYQTKAPSKHCHSVKKERTEILWTNYNPEKPND